MCHQHSPKWFQISHHCTAPKPPDAPLVPPHIGFSYMSSHGAARLSSETRGCVYSGTWGTPSAGCELCPADAWVSYPAPKWCWDCATQLTGVGMFTGTQTQTRLSNRGKASTVQRPPWVMGQLAPLNFCTCQALCISEQVS